MKSLQQKSRTMVWKFAGLLINCLAITSVISQNTPTGINLDNLNSNTSAAFVLLGISPTEIARPSSILDFAGSIQSSTNDFMSIPNTYGLEFCLKQQGGDTATTDKSVLSIGFVSNQTMDIPVMNLGVGLTWNLIDNELTDESKQAISAAENMNNSFGIRANSVVTFDSFIYKFSDLDINDFNNLNKAIPKAKVNRGGTFMDAHLGLTVSATNNDYENTQFSTAGGWLNFGYENTRNVTFIGSVKYIFEDTPNELEPMALASSVHNFDLGGRVIILMMNEQLELGLEGIIRSRSELGTDHKVGINGQVDVGTNKKLTFSIGRDFDGVVAREGNLFSLLNFISSF